MRPPAFAGERNGTAESDAGTLAECNRFPMISDDMIKPCLAALLSLLPDTELTAGLSPEWQPCDFVNIMPAPNQGKRIGKYDTSQCHNVVCIYQ